MMRLKLLWISKENTIEANINNPEFIGGFTTRR
jgi:hypothetical protein